MWLSRIVTVMSSWLNASKRNRDGSNEEFSRKLSVKRFQRSQERNSSLSENVSCSM